MGCSSKSPPVTVSRLATNMDLDETLCKAPMCLHPQCWETQRRIKQGHPRYRPLRSNTRNPRMDAAGLPVLSITTLPIKQTLPNKQDVEGASLLLTNSGMSTPSMYNSEICSMNKILFPGMNSYRELTPAPRGVESFLSTRKPWKVATVDQCSQDQKNKQMMMVWVPNSQQKFQENREKPLKIHIKELTFRNVAGQLRRENQDLRKLRKVTKPPTGGRPHNLILDNSSMETPARKCFIKESPDEIMRIRRSGDYLPYSKSLPGPGPDDLLLENQPVVLHDRRSKYFSSPIFSQSSPVYKLNEQNIVAVDNVGNDLNSIRNQYYLWKKYFDLAGPSCRINLPGSVVCDIERSHKLDSRESPSSAVLSHTWTEEPSDIPADLDLIMISEQDFLGEHTKESNQLTEDENILQILPDFESGHLFKGMESLKESELPDISEHTILGSEVTDSQNSPEQRTQSPQPNPPPPSPTHRSIN
ncbi:uncharacterized protein C9orf43 homolog isoform X2 [Pyxicephalus adspersus]